MSGSGGSGTKPAGDRPQTKHSKTSFNPEWTKKHLAMYYVKKIPLYVCIFFLFVHFNLNCV